MTDAPERITYNPGYKVTYEVDDPSRGYIYTRTDLADAAHRAGYKLARAEAAKLGADIPAYDVVMGRK